MTITSVTRPDEFTNQFAPEVTVADVKLIAETTPVSLIEDSGTRYITVQRKSNDTITDTTGWNPRDGDTHFCEYVSTNTHYHVPIHVQHARRVYNKPESVIVVRTQIGEGWVNEFIQPEHLDAAITAAADRLVYLTNVRDTTP
jgi:hypothetical protein